jgi:hypothetical protein
MKTLPIALALLAASLFLFACEKPAVDRAGRLLAMAGEEAAAIPNKLDRFTRQLNIADTLLRTNRKSEAIKTLSLARDTLKESAKSPEFDDFHRIAGWTAISQLSRLAGDRELALQTSDLAQAALNDVQPVTERPQYVLSLAGELADLRGNAAAIELVNSGGAWAAQIVEPNARRIALRAFTDRLLSYDAYENAQAMLRRDPDPVWRTDTLVTLANSNPGNFNQAYAQAPRVAMAGGRGGGMGGGRGTAAASPAQDSMNVEINTPSFGKDVRYENVFQQGNSGRP